MVSIQPEFPVCCRTSQPLAISTDSDTVIAASASRCKAVIQNP
jgi:hypothetical protein